VRLGPRDQEAGWMTSRTSTSASVYGSDRVDQVKMTDMRVKQASGGLGGWPVEDNGDTH